MDIEKANPVRRVVHSIINIGPVKKFLTENRWFARQYFQYLYAKPDPYRADTEFEIARYERAFSLVADSHFSNALEIGCGEGLNTWRIAKISDSVLATDLSANAIRRAAARNTDRNVRFETLDIVSDTLGDQFDYLFCAEVLYYVSLRQMGAVVEKMASLLVPGGVMHLCTTGPSGTTTGDWSSSSMEPRRSTRSSCATRRSKFSKTTSRLSIAILC